jgi:hypothetical protein
MSGLLAYGSDSSDSGDGGREKKKQKLGGLLNYSDSDSDGDGGGGDGDRHGGGDGVDGAAVAVPAPAVDATDAVENGGDSSVANGGGEGSGEGDACGAGAVTSFGAVHAHAAPCDADAQRDIARLLESHGRGFVASISQTKEFNNPYALQGVASFFSIDTTASCYPPHLFDPAAFAPSDYYEQLAAAQRAAGAQS